MSPDFTEELSSVTGSTSFADVPVANVRLATVNGEPYFDAPEYTVFVHGWNMAMVDKEAFAQTMYKRLYWQGYKGRFAAYDWPTFYDAEGSRRLPLLNYFGPGSDTAINFTYNASELQAFRSGTALMHLLEQRNNEGYGVNLLAHSMGNVVAGEAMRQWSAAHPTTPLVDSYVAMEGAVSAGVYADRAVNNQYVTDLYGYWSSGRYGTPTDPPLFSGIHGAAAKWVNMYNPVDAATSWAWDINNTNLKSQSYAPANIWNHQYSVTVDETGIHCFRDDSEAELALLDAQGSLGTDAYEIIAFLAQANTMPIGTHSVAVWFDVNTDIRAFFGLGNSADSRPNHSFQFHYDAAWTWEFYAHLKQQIGFEATY